jgi:hypothetical protein
MIPQELGFHEECYNVNDDLDTDLTSLSMKKSGSVSVLLYDLVHVLQ